MNTTAFTDCGTISRNVMKTILKTIWKKTINNEPTSQSKDDILDDDPDEKAKNVTFFDLYTNQFKITSIFKFIEYHR